MLIQENPDLNPVLFPKYSGVQNLNVDLLTTASNYDDENPNLITKLVPPHYFDEGFSVFGFKNFDQPLAKHYSGSNLPGSGDLGSSQILSAILYVWAKHFDEIKSMLAMMLGKAPLINFFLLCPGTLGLIFLLFLQTGHLNNFIIIKISILTSLTIKCL